MAYAIFTRANGSRFAFVDHFGKGPRIVELPKEYDHQPIKSPASLMNVAAYASQIDPSAPFKDASNGDYVDVPPHIAQELADAGGAVYETFTAY